VDDIVFRAQAFVETKINGSRAELAFANESGDRAVISLPLKVAAALGPVFSKLETDLKPTPGGPQHVEHLAHWRIGPNDEGDRIILLLNDRVPLALSLDHAAEFVAGIRTTADELRNKPPPVRQ